MDYLEDIKKQRDSLSAAIAEIERVRKKDEEKQWPEIGDNYLAAGTYGALSAAPFRGVGEADLYIMRAVNAHRTSEQAELYKKWLTSPRTQARRMVEMCDGFDAVGEYSVISNRDGTYVRVVCNRGWAHGMGGINFGYAAQAEAAICGIGEPLIKVALGVITGEEAESIVMEAMRK